jgi:hypothetical protein
MNNLLSNQYGKITSFKTIDALKPKSLSIKDFNDFIKNRTPRDEEIDRIRSMKERGVPFYSNFN